MFNRKERKGMRKEREGNIAFFVMFREQFDFGVATRSEATHQKVELIGFGSSEY